ncbi:MAG: HAD family phosphatase [Paracoccaceae bacterium]
MKPEAVVFDIGNVLIEWNPERFYDGRIGRAAREALFDEVDLEGMNLAIDAGALFRETIFDLADRTPKWRDEIRMWYLNWIEMASPRIEHSIGLLRALRAKGVPVFALTNFGVHSYAYARTQYEFFDEFDRAYVSGAMGVIKPDPQIYAMLEADSGVAPERLLFTDDKAENIAAAAARGWQVHLFEGAAGWAATLVEAGLLTAAEAGI